MTDPTVGEPADVSVEVDVDHEAEDELVADRHHVVVDAAHAGERIDAILASVLPGISRTTAQRLIEEQLVTIGGQPVKKAGYRLDAGIAIEVTVPVPQPIEVVPEAIPLVILHEDTELIVVDKPAGLVVHPAPGHQRGTLVNALLHHCTDLGGIGGEIRPGIVHRLDKDTSGVMVIAKTERAHVALVAMFAAKSRGEGGTIEREYLGLTAPPPQPASGTYRTYHGRHPHDRKRFSSKVTWGKRCVTHYEQLERLGTGAALVRFRLETGRTHQIRVHAADHNWPLLGDLLYGKPPRLLADVAARLGRQALHAALLAFDHPVTGARLRFECPLPPDLVATLAELRVT